MSLWESLSGMEVLYVIVAFSALIFVHELGHFLAALAMGVRVERFFIGIDAWGWGISRDYKGIKFGIGFLPLGGYVKLAGDSDVPGERKNEIKGAPGELMSKGPAARALIFSAGVIMNFIFGFLILVASQIYGVPRTPAVLGYVEPYGPAARAGLKAGDRVLAVDGKEMRWFSELQQAVALEGQKPLRFVMERKPEAGSSASTFSLIITPEESTGRGNFRIIGAFPERSCNVYDSLTELADGKPLNLNLRRGDTILAVNGEPIADGEGQKLISLADKNPGKELSLTIKPADGSQSHEVKIPSLAVDKYDIGISYQLAAARIMPGSAAEKAGMLAGDRIVAVNGKPIRANYDLIDTVKKESFIPLAVKVRRGGAEVEASMLPRQSIGSLVASNGKENFLGVRLKPGSMVVDLVAAGEAAEGKLQPGDEIISLNGKPVDAAAELGSQVAKVALKPVKLALMRGEAEMEKDIIPEFSKATLQLGIQLEFRNVAYKVMAGSVAEAQGITAGDGGFDYVYSPDLKKTTVSWWPGNQQPVWWQKLLGEGPQRKEKCFDTPAAVLADPLAAGLKGFLPFDMLQKQVMDRAGSLGEAMAQALPETKKISLSIYAFIGKLANRDISITGAGGPIAIFQAMYHSAENGAGNFLYIVALISINLAILNLLPIPMLDGGHILFVIIEVIKGSRPSVKLEEYAHYAGFVFIISLFAVIMGVDVYYLVVGH